VGPYVFVVPESLVARNTLGGLNPYPQCLGTIGKITFVEHAEQDDGRILFTHVCLTTGLNPRGDKERKSGDTADLLAVKVVNLDESFLVPKGIDLADIGFLLHDVGEQVGSRGQNWFQRLSGGFFSQSRDDARHSKSFPPTEVACGGTPRFFGCL
jgi:hypothetical protein